MQQKKKSGDNSDYPGRIRALRDAAGMTQVAFAKALGTARSMLAACESEENPRRPSASLLVSLGNVAALNKRYGDAVWFWQCAGLAIEGMMPAALEMLEATNLAVPVGSVTSIPELPSTRSVTSPAILFDTRLLRNPYAAKYIVPQPGKVLIVDTQQTDIWKLSGHEIAVLRRALPPEETRAVKRAFSDPVLIEYSHLLIQEVGEPSLHWGWLSTSRRGEASVVSLESRTAMGLLGSHILAIEIEGGGGRAAKMIESPFFYVLGQVVAQIDLRGPDATPYTWDQFQKQLQSSETQGSKTPHTKKSSSRVRSQKKRPQEKKRK
jgi:transcriptional regulator with XRE-family HTH domain